MAALYAVFAFCRNIPASEKSLLRRSGLLPGNPPPRGLPIIFSPQSVSGRVSCRYRTESTRELSEPKGVSHVGHPSNVVPFTKHRARAATNVRRSPIPVCRLMLRVPLGTAAASSAVEAGAGGAASPPLCPTRYRSQSVLPVHRGRAHPLAMGSKSRETIYGGSVRAAAERARCER